MREVVIDSMADLHRKADRMTPRQTGYLRSHVTVEHGQQVTARRSTKRPTEAQRRSIAAKGPPDIRAALADFKMGETIRVSWRSWYAGFVEYGAKGRGPVGYVRRAAESWRSIVRRNAKEVAARMRGKRFRR